ncbi:hypothetical protein I302_100428 [Kwoniella bestiolae CBS 10118]|uniref:Uncharacterized protein n=1 Tax=Kwoniella bestiolae CBS 10118 TaxID=1296100 RepID=A0A1B9G514_9TREE|nr:hypothetical protein I302_03804 [Kwoniella bestiolae CBS 10118]OCF26127.1 hypothetical protein I302_03804 [Kwoniella bestiolae CBS 10118]
MTSPNEPIRPNSAEESQVYRHELIIGVSRLSNYILTLPKIPIHIINLDCSCLAQDTSARPIDKNGMLAMLKNLMMQDLPRISALSSKNGGNREMAAAKIKEDGGEKFKNITFTSMRDFIDSGRWKGVIDDEKIRPWL